MPKKKEGKKNKSIFVHDVRNVHPVVTKQLVFSPHTHLYNRNFEFTVMI